MIAIRLAAIAGRPSLTIEDDGTGFDSAVSGRLGMGLSIMAHRSRMVGAEFRVGSGEMGGRSCRFAPVLMASPRRCLRMGAMQRTATLKPFGSQAGRRIRRSANRPPGSWRRSCQRSG